MKKLLLLALFWCCAYAVAEVPSTVAIRNAKIVTVSGAVIAKGTVIVRNGLIEAVGENVAVPADAWVVDGEGMTVYPGLIDRSHGPRAQQHWSLRQRHLSLPVDPQRTTVPMRRSLAVNKYRESSLVL